MSHYYVDSNAGTADGTTNGRYASQQSGAITALGAANYYSSSLAANVCPTPPVSGDIVYLAKTSAEQHTSGSTNVQYIDGVLYLSV